VLATYSYPLEKAWALRDKLRKARLTDPAWVTSRDVQEIGNSLKAADYDRGGITYIIAPRVMSLSQAVASGRLDSLPGHLAAGHKDAFVAALQQVKGFGPKSAGLAWELLRQP
jgi:hypothetical protein